MKMPARIILWLLAYFAFPALLALCLALAGCMPGNRPRSLSPRQGPTYLFWSRTVTGPQTVAWEKEFERRFHRAPIVLACHGGIGPGGRWWIYPDDRSLAAPTETVVALIHRLDPSRPILVLACNPGAAQLHTPDVYYATGSVWDGPWGDWPGACGKIDDFVKSK
jgi:hypothetical protein